MASVLFGLIAVFDVLSCGATIAHEVLSSSDYM